MSMNEKAKIVAGLNAMLGKNNGISEDAEVHGRYSAVCRDKDGNIKWSDEFDNLVTNLGKALLLDTFLSGSAYTVTGPFLGLINGSAANVAAADTLASRTGGWAEVGATNAPAYTAPRKTVAWNAASGGSKSNSTALTFSFTSGGTVGGAFLVLGSGAVSTIDSTAGILYSARAFTGGSKTVAASDTLTVTYTAQA